MPENKNQKQVKDHFEQEAEEFDEIILKLIPFYEEMIEALLTAIPFNNDKEIKVMDLGCGTGTIAKKIKEKFPNAQLTCLDLSENMIEMAKLKLANFSDVNYQVADFYNFDFSKKYDVIVSSLALHHLITAEDKQMFYRKNYQALATDGVFYNADVVLGATDQLQEGYMGKWIEYMSQSCSQAEIENKWLVKYREEDNPAKLIDQINWLDEIGFADVDVVWKYYNYAVYGGRKDSC
jgi:tRNA (cmo5U34)-methyltransferase